jgi:hypothetical protein
MRLLFLLLALTTGYLSAQPTAPRYVVLTHGDTLFAQHIVPGYLIHKGGWINVTDLNGEVHRLEDGAYDHYQVINRQGQVERWRSVVRREGQRPTRMLWAVRGAVNVYLDDYDYPPVMTYVEHPGYRGYVKARNYRKRLMAYLDGCEAFRAAFPPEERRRFKELVHYAARYNALCR